MSGPEAEENNGMRGQGGAQGQPQYGANGGGQPQPQYGAYGNGQSQGQNSSAQGNQGQWGSPDPGQYGPFSSNPNQHAYSQSPYGNQPGPQGGSQEAGQNPQGSYGSSKGEWWQVNPFNLIEEILPQKAKNAIRAIYGVIGVAAIILGAALLFWPGATITVFAVALGIYFLVSGIIRLVSAIVEVGLPSGWRVLDILVGILLAIGGVIVLKNSALSGVTLTMVVTLMVGIGWIMEGIMALVESWRMPSSGWTVFYAIISVIAGTVILFNPFASTTVLVIFGGWALVILGIFALVRAFRFGKTPKDKSQR